MSSDQRGRDRDKPLPADELSTDLGTFGRALEEERLPELKRLLVVEGRDAGKVFELDAYAPSRILLGTSSACAIKLTDTTISRRHASFEPTAKGGAYRLTDLGSKNGTFVDGVRIVEVFVRGGEVVRFGGVAVRLEAELPAAHDTAPLPTLMRFGRTFGASIAMRRMYLLCERLARTPAVPVLIEGEPGTGKEVLAESLHEAAAAAPQHARASSRPRPFVVFDCAATPPTLVDAELFGGGGGAAAAHEQRPGAFEEAAGGTLVLDEIGELDLTAQAKLLRVLDRGAGSVRVIATTRRDLDKEVAGGRFRDDLFNRLCAGRIELPPLRDRHGDVPILTRQFVQELGGPSSLSQEIVAHFGDYHWPGNVRELRDLVARYVALGTLPTQSDVQQTTSRPDGDWLDALIVQRVPFSLARRRALEEFERRYVSAVLAQHGGNIAEAAKASGIALRYFRLVRARHR